jgi:hypothetical protein
VALFPTHASDASALIQYADKAMYLAKSGARASLQSLPAPDAPGRTQ